MRQKQLMLVNRFEGTIRWVGWFYKVALNRSLAYPFIKESDIDRAVEKFKERFKVYVVDEETGEVIKKYV